MRRAMIFLFCAVFLAIAVAPGWSEEEKKIVGPAVGNYMADFSLENAIDGKTIGLKDVTGKKLDTAFLFMQTACSLCKAEVLDFTKAQGDLAGKLNVVLVSVDIDKGRLPGYAKAYGIPYPILHDGDAAFLGKVGMSSTPGFVLINSDGKILKNHTGYDMGETKSLIKKYAMQ